MKWEDERYVRSYTRDTTTWLRWTWEARATFALLLRKVDRNGCLALDGEAPGDAVALHTGLPSHVAESGMAQILKPDKNGTATAVLDGDRIALPNYRAAQETRSSDRKRAKDYRERKAESDIGNGVSEAHTTDEESSRSVTEHAESVTDNHTASPVVTRRHSVPSVAGRSGAVPSGTKDPCADGADPLALSGEPEPPKPPRAKKPPPEHFATRDEAMAAIAGGSGGWFVPSTPAKGAIFQLDKVRRRPDALAAFRRIGEWLKAGGDWRIETGRKFDGSDLGKINAWLAQSEAWDGNPITRRGNGAAPDLSRGVVPIPEGF